MPVPPVVPTLVLASGTQGTSPPPLLVFELAVVAVVLGLMTKRTDHGHPANPQT